MGNFRKVATLLLATIAVAVGAAAPAFAGTETDRSRAGRMVNWANGQKSWSWNDATAESRTRVTFAKGCTREFTATIRRHRAHRPDPHVGREHIDCQSYKDAVKAKRGETGTYHFDVSRLGQVCYSGTCRSYVTSGTFKAFW